MLTSEEKSPPRGRFTGAEAEEGSAYKPAVVLAGTVFSRRSLRFQVVLGSQRPHRTELRGILDRARPRPLVGAV